MVRGALLKKEKNIRAPASIGRPAARWRSSAGRSLGGGRSARPVGPGAVGSRAARCRLVVSHWPAGRWVSLSACTLIGRPLKQAALGWPTGS